MSLSGVPSEERMIVLGEWRRLYCATRRGCFARSSSTQAKSLSSFLIGERPRARLSALELLSPFVSSTAEDGAVPGARCVLGGGERVVPLAGESEQNQQRRHDPILRVSSGHAGDDRALGAGATDRSVRARRRAETGEPGCGRACGRADRTDHASAVAGGRVPGFTFYIVPDVNPGRGGAQPHLVRRNGPISLPIERIRFREPPGRDVEFGYPEIASARIGRLRSSCARTGRSICT